MNIEYDITAIIKWIVINIFIFIVCACPVAFSDDSAGGKELNIAVVGPFSGKYADKGSEMLNGVKLHVERINSRGGINGRSVKILAFDDENNPSTASERAAEIASNDNILFVIGHWSNAASLAGGKIYEKRGIPVITASATADDVTRSNDWFFRVVFNNEQQGKIIAHYINQVLGHRVVSIIHTGTDYSLSLTEAFENASQRLRMTVNYKWGIDLDKADTNTQLEKIVRELKEKRHIGALFLAVDEDEGAVLIRHIRDLGLTFPIFGGTRLGNRSFPSKFRDFPMERINPGFYTDNMYCSVFFISDALERYAEEVYSGYAQKFGKDPGAAALFYYDAVGLALDAVRRTDIKLDRVSEDRKKIRDYLSGISDIRKAYRGVTGYLYFDENGDAVKSVPVGIFKNTQLISAPVQLNPAANLMKFPSVKVTGAKTDKTDDTRKEKGARGDIISIDGVYFQKTNFVYTGIEPFEISDWDTAQSTCTMDFFLWFRFQEGIDPENIEILNAAEPIPLGKAVDEKITGRLIYRKYHIKGRFKTDFLSEPPEFGSHVMGISFHHRALSRDRLIYIIDVLGMNITETSKSRRLPKNILSTGSGWNIDRINFHSDIFQKNAMGDPFFMSLNQGKVDYSRFDMAINVKKSALTLRRLIPAGLLNTCLMIIAAVILLSATLPGMIGKYGDRSKILIVFQTFSVCLLLVTLEIFLLNYLKGRIDLHHLRLIKRGFDVLWWIVPAYILTKIFEHFIWIPFEKKAMQKIPSLLIHFVNLLIFLLAIFGVIAFVFDQKLTSLLATSGVIAMIIGLAIQINISNIFSGIALNLERPFRVGDWIKVTGYDEGLVVDITWRTTRIMTWFDTIVSIPNSVASESVVHNFHLPSKTYYQSLTIHVDISHRPEKVEQILIHAVKEMDFINAVTVRFSIGESSGQYTMLVETQNYTNKYKYRDAIQRRIWDALEKAGIRLIAPRRDIRIVKEDDHIAH